MLYRPPMVPHERFVADPPELPVPAPGHSSPGTVTRADLLDITDQGIHLKAATTTGETLTASITASAPGVIRVRLSAQPDAAPRATRALRHR